MTSTVTMADADAKLARRMFGAVNHLERQLGRKVTLEELGADVARAYGREGDPFAPSVVARWVKGQQEPKTRRLWFALATALRVDPGWLAFGEATLAPAPDGYQEAEEKPARKRRAS